MSVSPTWAGGDWNLLTPYWGWVMEQPYGNPPNPTEIATSCGDTVLLPYDTAGVPYNTP